MPQNAQKTNTLATRPPVIAVMGHIDHGKSTLLDHIRHTNIVDKEAGGITQHVSAYEVDHTTSEGKELKITFLDTPGHAAFSGIRERGANIADIAVLVVSAEDGVKPQTLEALGAIKKAELPYVVAMNKIDKPAANIEKTKANLAENGIFIEGYGGNIPAVQISAKTGQGVSELLDMLVLLADLEDFKGDAALPAYGYVLESNLDQRKGITATLIIKDGAIKRGQFVSAGGAFAPVRIMENFLGKPASEATFSSPVRIIGWDKLPAIGAEFRTFATKEAALTDAQSYKETLNKKESSASETSVIVPVILKADTLGSLEAIENELAKLSTEKVTLKIIQPGIGQITETDLKSALSTKDPVIVGFNVKPDATAKSYALRNELTIQEFNIIYKLTEWFENIVKERTPKEIVLETTGVAKVLKIFSVNKEKQVLGGRVETGLIKQGQEVKIMRRGAEVGLGRIRELQQNKSRTGSVEEGLEFGSLVECPLEIAPGDRLKAFEKVEK